MNNQIKYRLPISLGIALLLFLFFLPALAFAATPTFEQYRLLFRGPDLTKGVALGDMDGDGDLDIVVGNIGEADAENPGEQSVVYLNDGFGYFPTVRLVGTATDRTTSVAVGDLNDDGYLDIVAGRLEQQNAVYLNDGLGNFGMARMFGPHEGKTQSVAIGDMEGDRDLDIVVGNDGQQNFVYLNDGQGNFGTAHPFGPSQDKTQSVAIGDMDGNGKLDIVVGNDGEPNVVYLNDGNGNFNTGHPFGAGLDKTHSIAVGDMNGDQKLDIIVGNRGQRSALYWNDGLANFTRSSPLGIGPDPTESVAVGDMDGDRDLDIIVGNHGQQNSSYSQDRIYFNNGAGAFPTRQPFGTGSDGTQSVVVGDIDGDSDLDIVVGNGEPSIEQNAIYLNDGASNFTTNVRLTKLDKTKSVAVGDMDNDGDLDLVIGNAGEQNLIYLNDGSSHFTPVWPFGTGADDTQSVAVGDLDSDGDLDLVVGNAGEPNAVEQSMIYLNQSNGNFSEGIALGHGTDDTQSVAVGDLDGDGKLDIVLGNAGGQNAIYFNKGGGDFNTKRLVDTKIYDTHAIAIGDMDQDGDLDLVVGNAGEPNWVYMNDGNGNFEPAYDFGTGKDDTRSVALGDMDGDGTLDIAVGNVGEQSAVYLNKGAGNFKTAHPFGTGLDDTHSVAIGDMDGDGDLDLVVGNAGEQNVVHFNDGHGNFNQTIPFGTGYDFTQSVAVGDLNGDGRLDLVVGNRRESNSPGQYIGEQNAVYLNQSLPAAITTTRPGSTANANFLSTAAYLTDTLIAIPYVLYDATAQTVGKIRVCYSLDGGAHWQLAVTADKPTVTPAEIVVPSQGCPYVPLWEKSRTYAQATTPIGVPYTFLWDIFASGFWGQSDQVVIRIEAYTDLYPYHNQTAGSYQYAYRAATTFPFRVRGTQIQVIDESSTPLVNAQVYRLPNGQMRSGALIASGNTPFYTNVQGYLQGRGQIGLGDQLLALASQPLPPTMTARYSETVRLYSTNGRITPDGKVETWINNTQSSMVTQPGVQVLQVRKQQPLLLFDVDVALEWDASKEPRYLEQLKADLYETSRYLYDFTNGQVALGRVRVAQDADNWGHAHIVVHATNQLRPYATILGAIITDTADFSLTLPITYTSGQIHIGSIWNRYGDINPNPGIDWPLILAHEVSHYLLGLEDTYLGLAIPPTIGEKVLVNNDTCGSAMGDVYNPGYTEFIFSNALWQAYCAQTLANAELQRNEWQTITGWFPWLVAPTQVISGPSVQPFTFTTIDVFPPITPTTVLLNQAFYLDYTGNVSSTADARVFLLRDDNRDGLRDYIYDLGSAIGDQKLLRAHGVQPGDQLCVFDQPRHQAGCESVQEGDDHIQLVQQNDWQPVVQVSLVTSTTFTIQVINRASPNDFVLQARIFPEFGTEPASTPLLFVDPASGSYRGTLKINQPALAGHLYIASTVSNRQAIVAYNIGGNPGNWRSSGGGFSRGGGNWRSSGGGFSRGEGNWRSSGGAAVQQGDAPAVSPDGKLIFFATDRLSLAEGQFYTVQEMAGLPPLPAGKTAIGQGYNLAATGFPLNSNPLPGSVSIQYVGLDVLKEKADENQLTIHFWNGQQWRALATHRDPKFNLASARSQGPGIYALLAGVTTPQITAIAPALADNSQDRPLTIAGSGFLAPLSVLLVAPTATYTLPIQSISSTQISVLVTSTVMPNEYAVVVVNRNEPGGAYSAMSVHFSFFAASSDCFYDFFDSGAAKWTRSGAWDIATPIIGEEAMTDSPAGPYHDASDYAADQIIYTTSITSTPFSLAACNDAPGLVFAHDYTLGRSPLGEDRAIVELSTDGGLRWTQLISFTGGGVFDNGFVESAGDSLEWHDVLWKQISIPLQAYTTAQSLLLRFTLRVNNDHVTSRGWIIKEVHVRSGVPVLVDGTDKPGNNQLFLPIIAR